MTATAVEVVREAWSAFARGDLPAVTHALDPGVRWYPARDPEAAEGCQNREEALAFLRRAIADGTSADLVDVLDAGERVVLILHRHKQPDLDERPPPHGELVTVRDGRITEMLIYWTAADPLAAAGLSEDPPRSS
ncbi:MAG TPA: nuclear transport factor 2 family protein [Solirubrobacteraceae bacterium]|nr:nuclear transport factor 2 family protein [Solirubrobacteraceae bacterium]